MKSIWGTSPTAPKGPPNDTTNEAGDKRLDNQLQRLTKEHRRHEEVDENELNSNQKEMTQIQDFLDQQKNEFITKQRNISNNKKQDQQTEQQNDDNNLPVKTTTTITNITNNKNNKKQKGEEKKIISIATHNVRGINNKLDQNNIIIEMQTKNIDILGLSQTKFNSNNQNFAFKNSSQYKCFSSAKPKGMQTYGSGVAIIIEKELAKHVG